MSGININLPAAFEQEMVYKECRHNHAASLGRVAFDGCREFLKPGDADGGTKEAMLCVACGCHRNFHRKDTLYNPIMTAATAAPTPHQTHHQPDFPAAGPSASTTRVVQFINHETTTMHAAPAVAAGNNSNAEEATPEPPPGRKKRTMFTVEQRSRMTRFAERLGWRPQRTDKEEIQHFCLEMGISRRMFLVWLSNNRRRVVQNNTTTATATTSA